MEVPCISKYSLVPLVLRVCSNNADCARHTYQIYECVRKVAIKDLWEVIIHEGAYYCDFSKDIFMAICEMLKQKNNNNKKPPVTFVGR